MCTGTGAGCPGKPQGSPSHSLDSTKAHDEHNKKIEDYQKNPNTLYIYTDGSKINRAGFSRVGAGATAYHEGREVAYGRLGLGRHAEVFDAEMAAVALGTEKAEEFIQNFPNTTHIAFFTDNAAATTAITDPKPKTLQYFTIKFHQIIQPLLETHANLSVSISWCPSHLLVRAVMRGMRHIRVLSLLFALF